MHGAMVKKKQFLQFLSYETKDYTNHFSVVISNAVRLTEILFWASNIYATNSIEE